MTAGRGDDGPAGLDEQACVEPCLGHGLCAAPRPLGDRRRRLALDVGHAQATAERQRRRGRSGRANGGHDLGRLGERLDREDLRADVGVEPDQLDGGAALRPLDRPPRPRRSAGRSRTWSRPGRCCTNSWVWASTPGVTRSCTLGAGQTLGVQGVEAVELVEAVDDDAARRRR